MSAEIKLIPSWNEFKTRVGLDLGLQHQYQRELDATDRAMQEPPPRTRPILLRRSEP